MIQKLALQKRTKVDSSQLNLSDIGVKHLKPTNPNVVKNFKLFLNNMILFLVVLFKVRW